MNKIITFPERAPMEIFTEHVTNCPYKLSTVRGAVSTLRGDNSVFLIWEAEDPVDETEKEFYQFRTSFADAEMLFFQMLSTMGKAKWHSNRANVQKFISKLNNTVATLPPNNGVNLPEISFRKVA